MDHARKVSTTSLFPIQSRSFPAPALSHPGAEGQPLAAVEMRAGLLALRDAIPSDADAYVEYWHYSGDRIKNLLGIDLRKLGTPADSRRRFVKMIRVPGLYQPDVMITITLNAHVIGYTNINRYGSDDNYIHLHTYRSRLRQALDAGVPLKTPNARAGVAVAAIGIMMEMYFNILPVHRLVIQTLPDNRRINKALDVYMPPAETRYLDNPAGLAAPGLYHLRYVGRQDARWMLTRLKSLKESVPETKASSAMSPG